MFEQSTVRTHFIQRLDGKTTVGVKIANDGTRWSSRIDHYMESLEHGLNIEPRQSLALLILNRTRRRCWALIKPRLDDLITCDRRATLDHERERRFTI